MARCAVLVLVAMCCVPEAADACSCRRLHACSALWSAAAVFAGRVVDIRPATDGALRGARIVRFEVEHRGLAVPGTHISVHAYPQNGGNCEYTFNVGQRYIVQAYAMEGVLTTHMCGVVGVTEAPDELAFLKEVAGPARGGRLLGRVYRSEDSRLLTPGDERAGMIPVAGARVRVTGRVTRESTTGPDGKYNIRDLPLGTYEFSLVPPTGLAPPGEPLPKEQRVPERSTTVTFTRPFECAVRGFQVRTDSRILGSVHDARGAPLRNVPLDLEALDAVGRKGEALRITVRTDAAGAFVFAFVPPGRYAVAHGKRYHPGVRDRSQATVVTVRAGDRVQLAPMTP